MSEFCIRKINDVKFNKDKIMKRNILFLLIFIAVSAMAQPKFGYVSYKEILKALPEVYSLLLSLRYNYIQGKSSWDILLQDPQSSS